MLQIGRYPSGESSVYYRLAFFWKKEQHDPGASVGLCRAGMTGQFAIWSITHDSDRRQCVCRRRSRSSTGLVVCSIPRSEANIKAAIIY